MPLRTAGKIAVGTAVAATVIKSRRMRGRARRGGIFAALVGFILDILGVGLIIYGFIQRENWMMILGGVVLVLGIFIQVFFMMRRRRRNRRRNNAPQQGFQNQNSQQNFQQQNQQHNSAPQQQPQNQSQAQSGGFCQSCGSPVSGQFCQSCGSKT